MKLILIAIVLLIATSFAYYSEPPISEVTNYNGQIELRGIIPENTTGFDNCIIDSDPSLIAERGAIETITMHVVSAFPAIDNRVSYVYPPSVFWSYGEKHKETITWETELSGTTCTSSADFVGFEPYATINFAIGSATSSISTNTTPVSIPDEMKSLLGNTNENSIIISMDGVGLYIYDLDIYSVVCTPTSGCSCEKNTQASGEQELKFRCTNSLSYEIENQEVVSLLQKPILKEQWYKNNHFDSLLLTNRKIYKAEVSLNDTPIGTVKFYEFDVSSDEYGLESISTIATYYENNATGAENFAGVTPIPLQKENNTFKYVYEINSTYEGIGLNTLTLKAYDDFGQEIELSEEITSKELSFSGNISESNKTVSNGQNIIASSAWEPMTYNLVFITMGVAGLLIVFVVFKIRWD